MSAAGRRRTAPAGATPSGLAVSRSMGLLGLPVPGPTDAVRAVTGAYTALDHAVALVPRLARLLDRLEALTDRAEGVIDRVDEVVAAAAGTVGRVDGVVDQASGTVGRVDGVVDRADGTVGRVDGVVDRADGTVGRVDGVVTAATGVVDGAAGAVGRADAVIGEASDLTLRITRTTDDREIEAIIHLIDTLPDLVDTLRADVLPVMSTLGTVAPDLRDLLDIAGQLNGVITSVPGLGRLKRRVEKAQAEDDGSRYTADEEPPSSPDRDVEDP